MERAVKVYIGTQEDNYCDYMYVDLLIDGAIFSIWSSDKTIEEVSGQQYADMLGEAMNNAKILSKLGLTISIDDNILDCAEEISDNALKESKLLLKEIL